MWSYLAGASAGDGRACLPGRVSLMLLSAKWQRRRTYDVGSRAMLDSFALLSTTLCILYVAFRAAALDRQLPWFMRERTGDRQRPVQRSDVPDRGSPRF